MKAPLNVDMTGKVALVTGATGGIGKEIARALVRMGAGVVIGARDERRGETARAELAADAVLRLDVSDVDSIRRFAAAFGDRYDRLDVLVNNAGAWFTDRRESPQGLELSLATNVLGPHLLTELLSARLRAADRTRVVNLVSSIVGDYDVTDLQFTRRPFDGYKAYSQSKQALRMLTWGQADRLAPAGINVNAAAPGFVRSNLNRHASGARVAMIGLSARLVAVSPAKGADTPVWAAVAPALEHVTGRYFAGRRARDGKFHEPGPVAELERHCRELAAAVGQETS